MLTVGSPWVGDIGQDDCHALASDGTYIYVAIYNDPGQVVKIYPATMTTVKTWTGDQNYCDALAYNSNYLYAGFQNWPAHIVKIKVTIMKSNGVLPPPSAPSCGNILPKATVARLL
jgi:hypothetical protein